MVKNKFTIDKTKLLQVMPLPAVMHLHSGYWTHDGFGVITNQFNCSIIKDRRLTPDPGYIFSYRIETKPIDRLTRAAVVRLNSKFEPDESTNRLIEAETVYGNYVVDDVRLFWHNGVLHYSYTDRTRMGFGTLDSGTLETLTTGYIEGPLHVPQEEKNWGFFSHNSNLHAVYNIFPHEIITMDGRWANKTYLTKQETWWDECFGEAHGGAPPLLINGIYYNFFQSSITSEKNTKDYFLGCYTFESKPPFTPISYLPNPILECDKLTDEEMLTRGSLHRANTLFPCGAELVDDSTAVVSYGDRDINCGMVTIDIKKLNSELVSHQHLGLRLLPLSASSPLVP